VTIRRAGHCDVRLLDPRSAENPRSSSVPSRKRRGGRFGDRSDGDFRSSGYIPSAPPIADARASISTKSARYGRWPWRAGDRHEKSYWFGSYAISKTCFKARPIRRRWACSGSRAVRWKPRRGMEHACRPRRNNLLEAARTTAGRRLLPLWRDRTLLAGLDALGVSRRSEGGVEDFTISRSRLAAPLGRSAIVDRGILANNERQSRAALQTSFSRRSAP